ncbi:MAG: NADH-quinone oxidoreductase subunit L, partial [Propionibacterium sp.]|nr:NADH-quinone oxidoreductase subunit L [Propionibacterium sp.]
LGVVAVGVFIGWFMFKDDIPKKAPKTNNVFAIAGRNDLYGDAFNEHAIIRPTKGLAAGLAWFDDKAVDGVPEGGAVLATGLGGLLRKAQNGYSRTYGLTIAVGVVALAVFIVLGQLG